MFTRNIDNSQTIFGNKINKTGKSANQIIKSRTTDCFEKKTDTSDETIEHITAMLAKETGYIIVPCAQKQIFSDDIQIAKLQLDLTKKLKSINPNFINSQYSTIISSLKYNPEIAQELVNTYYKTATLTQSTQEIFDLSKLIPDDTKSQKIYIKTINKILSISKKNNHIQNLISGYYNTSTYNNPDIAEIQYNFINKLIEANADYFIPYLPYYMGKTSPNSEIASIQSKLATRVIDEQKKDLFKLFLNYVLTKEKYKTFYDRYEVYQTCFDSVNKNPELASLIIDIPSLALVKLLLQNRVSANNYKKFNQQNLDIKDISIFEYTIGCKFIDILNVTDINKISLKERKELLKNLMQTTCMHFNESKFLQKNFPLIPTSQKEHCELISKITKSIEVKTNPITLKEATKFNHALTLLSENLAKLTDQKFNDLTISQEISTENFINEIIEKTKNIPQNELAKACNYFGFELSKNENNSYTILGYPNIINDTKEKNISPLTLKIIDIIKNDVEKYTQNNPIVTNNKKITQNLNTIFKILPELHVIVNKPQHKTHSFDIFKHSLKVMQKIVQNDNFSQLNISDKKIMLLSALFHDITKGECEHEKSGSFVGYCLSQKFKLTNDEQNKLYKLIKNHEWLKKIVSSDNLDSYEDNIQSTAFDLQDDNLAKLSVIFTHADLKAVKSDDAFHDDIICNKNLIDTEIFGMQRGEAVDKISLSIDKYVNMLKSTQPILPATKFQKANEIKKHVSKIYPDRHTNIKGIYIDKNDAVVIKYNEVEDWEKIGFPKGSKSKGIITKNSKGECVDTGNIKFFVHGLTANTQLTKFDVFSLIYSQALLSVSYAQRPETKYKFFKPQGVILEVDNKNLYGGGKYATGSGKAKNIDEFKKNFITNGKISIHRSYISNLIRKETGMNEEEYKTFVQENKDKLITEIEPVELQNKIIEALSKMKSAVQTSTHEYNEFYVTNPKVSGVFAYAEENSVGNPIDYLNAKHKYKSGNIYIVQDLRFLSNYASEHNIPFVIFGD